MRRKARQNIFCRYVVSWTRTFEARQCRESSRKCWRHFLSQQCNCELFHEIQNYVQGNVLVCTSGSLCDPKVCVGKAMQNRRVIIVSPPSTTALRSALGSGRASLAFDFSLKSELIMQQKLRGSPQVRGNGCLKVCKVDNIIHASGSLCRS